MTGLQKEEGMNTIIFHAFRLLEERTVLPVKAARRIYRRCCARLHIKPTRLRLNDRKNTS